MNELKYNKIVARLSAQLDKLQAQRKEHTITYKRIENEIENLNLLKYGGLKEPEKNHLIKFYGLEATR